MPEQQPADETNPDQPVEEPLDGESMAGESVAGPDEPPVAEEPVVEQAGAEPPVAEEPVVEQAGAEPPVAQEPVVEQAGAEPPVAQEPVTEQAGPEPPVAEEPVVEQAGAEPPVAQEPVTEQAGPEPPVAQEPVTEQAGPEPPVAQEPVTEQAGPEPPTEPVTGRDRLVRALLGPPSRAQAVVAALLVVVGFAAVVQVRANEVDNSYAGLREQDLIDVLNGLSGTSLRAESEISRLESTRRDLENSTRSRQAALKQAQDRADTLAILAGLVPVTGPGIRVTVTEKSAPVDVDTMLDTIQELRAAGAEAMQINGKVRIVAQSSVEEAAGGIYVDGTLLSSPYVIDVIGEPHTLAGGMTFLQGPRSQFEEDGQTVQIDELQSLDIEAVRQPQQQEYAQPDTSQ